MKFRKISSFTDIEQKYIYGIDEAGRGPWAGPVVACAIQCKSDIRFQGLKDSKELSAQQREHLYKKIIQKCNYGLGVSTNSEIDKKGLIAAVNLAFERAIKELYNKKSVPKPRIILIDGNDKLKLPYLYQSIIKGDQQIKLIACASIIAKVERDRMMKQMHEKYPAYGFDQHKGYGTAKHHLAIKRAGLCPIHRISYKPLLPYIHNTSN